MADRTITYDFRGNFTDLKSKLTAGGRAVQDFGGKLTALDKDGARARAGLDHFGSVAGRVGLAAAAGLGAVVLASANFDQAMSNVAATGDDARASLDDLRQAAIDAGASTAFSATEAAAGIENLLKAGVSAQDVLDGGLTGALDLAAAGGLEVADAAELAATALTQFQLSGSDVPHVADLLAAAAGKAAGEVTDYGAALNQAGLVSAQFGLSIEETTGTLAALGSAGFVGSDAGTSLKTFLQALVPNSEKAAAAMEEMGFSAFDAQGNFVGMADVAGQLAEGLSDMTQEQQNATLKTIFGADAVRAAGLIYEQGADGIQSWIDKTNDSGYAAETAATKMDNLKGDLEAFKGSLETALIGSGDGSQGILRGLVQGATDAVNAFNGLPGPVQSTATALLGITAITGGGLWFGAKVIGGIADTKQALADLGVEAGRTRGILSGFAKAGAGLATLELTTVVLKTLIDQMKTPIDTSTLSRDLEALTDGHVTDNLQDLSIWLGDIQDKWETYNPVTILTPLDMSGFEDAERELGKIDNTLATLVEGGNAEHAAEIFAAIQEKAEAAGLSTAELNGIFSEYDTALLNAGQRDYWFNQASSAIEAARATNQAADATSDAGDAAADAKSKVNQLARAFNAQAEATLSAFGAETSWREALKAATRQGRRSEAGIKGMSGAALENRRQIESLASAWNSQSKSVRNNVGRFREAKKAFIDTAIAMGVPDRQARKLARSMLAIPKKIAARAELDSKQFEDGVDKSREGLKTLGRTPANPTIDADTKPFEKKKTAVERLIEGLTGKTAKPSVDLALDELYSGISATNTALNGIPDETVIIWTERKERKAAGGLAGDGVVYGPGTTTSDSVPAMLSRGEYVVKAAAVDHYGVGFFHDVNAMRLAEGGFADWAPRNLQPATATAPVGVASSPDPTHELRALRREVAALRGDVRAADANNVAGQQRQSDRWTKGAASAARGWRRAP